MGFLLFVCAIALTGVFARLTDQGERIPGPDWFAIPRDRHGNALK